MRKTVRSSSTSTFNYHYNSRQRMCCITKLSNLAVVLSRMTSLVSVCSSTESRDFRGMTFFIGTKGCGVRESGFQVVAKFSTRV